MRHQPNTITSVPVNCFIALSHVTKHDPALMAKAAKYASIHNLGEALDLEANADHVRSRFVGSSAQWTEASPNHSLYMPNA